MIIKLDEYVVRTLFNRNEQQEIRKNSIISLSHLGYVCNVVTKSKMVVSVRFFVLTGFLSS